MDNSQPFESASEDEIRQLRIEMLAKKQKVLDLTLLLPSPMCTSPACTHRLPEIFIRENVWYTFERALEEGRANWNRVDLKLYLEDSPVDPYYYILLIRRICSSCRNVTRVNKRLGIANELTARQLAIEAKKKEVAEFLAARERPDDDYVSKIHHSEDNFKGKRKEKTRLIRKWFETFNKPIPPEYANSMQRCTLTEFQAIYNK